jgi:undecaprenyl-diphosphatase
MGQRRLLTVAGVFLACFLLVASFRASFYVMNEDVNQWSASVNDGPFTLAAMAINFCFDTLPLFALSLVAAAALFVYRVRRYGFLVLGAMAGDALLVEFVKTVIASPRPLDGILNETGYSFPSGHTAGTVVFLGVLTYFAWKFWGGIKVKAMTVGLYMAVTALVGFDRLYLNVHWLSDVLGAVFLGAFWLVFCILVFDRALSAGSIQRFGTRLGDWLSARRIYSVYITMNRIAVWVGLKLQPPSAR